MNFRKRNGFYSVGKEQGAFSRWLGWCLYPLKKLWFWAVLLILALALPLLWGVKLTELHLWYGDKLKNAGANVSANIGKTIKVSPFATKGTDKLVQDTDNRPKNLRRQAFGKADIIDPVCRKIGATNLLVKTPEGVSAYNSDYYGIILGILSALDLNDMSRGINPRPTPDECRKTIGDRLRTALVVGCGGAGKAAAVAAGNLGLETVLMNRTAARAEAIASALPEYGFKVRPIEDFRDCFAAADLILYTLPAPIGGISELTDNDFTAGATIFQDNGAPQDGHTTETENPDTGNSAQDGHRRKILLEANYRNPSFREELTSRQMSVHKDFTYIPGHQWLLYQAYAGYDLFTGETPDLLSMAKIIM